MLRDTQPKSQDEESTTEGEYIQLDKSLWPDTPLAVPARFDNVGTPGSNEQNGQPRQPEQPGQPGQRAAPDLPGGEAETPAPFEYQF